MAQDHHTKPRLYLKTGLAVGADAGFSEDQWHYLSRVLRLKDGAVVRLFNEQDGEFAASLSGKTARVQEKIRNSSAPRFIRCLAFPLLSKDRLDFLIEKSVELGATHLQPVVTARSEIKTMNTPRIIRQVIEATEQCERFAPPVLAAPAPLQEWLASNALPVAAALERTPDTKKLFDIDFRRDMAFLVGPPGGFTDGERAALASAPLCTPVNLGDAILRTDTAALSLLAAAGALS